MDNPSQTSQRIRPILKAMEQSIEDARRRRNGDSSPRAAHADHGDSTPPASPPAHSQTTPTAPATAMPLHSAAQPAHQSIRPQSNQTVGRPAGNTSPGESDPEQPVRLKARPKRWLSASA